MALCGAGARDGRRDDGNACGKAAAAHWDRSDALRDRASSAAVSSFSLFGPRRRTRIVFAAFARSRCGIRFQQCLVQAQPALLNGLWWLIGHSVMSPSFPPLSFHVLMRSNSLRF